MTLELRTHCSIREIAEHAFSGLENPEGLAFLRYEWLAALEDTGCVRPERGWLPMHLTLHENDRLVGFAPSYVKGNSEGEFVFDHGWARFAHNQLNIDYYPKLVVAVPFTPATGPRVLCAPDVDRRRVLGAFAEGIRELTARLRFSGAHVLFPTVEQARALEQDGFVRRYGMQFHWKNAGYVTFDDFMSRFNSKRRHQIRRERRELDKQGTRIEIVTGRDITSEIVGVAFDFYKDTVSKYYWGRQYLNYEFFEEICARIPERIHIVLARDKASRKPLGGAFNLLGQRALYGRYWGAREPREFLHFNVCFYAGIEDCIARGLELFEPGAGGEHKLARGFEPTLTHSAHFLPDARFDHVVRDFVVREHRALTEHIDDWHRSPVLKPLAETLTAARSL